MIQEPCFEVASGEALRKKYGLTADNRPSIQLDASRVPIQFRQWIHLAERWGIADDLIREDCIEKAAPSELQEILKFGDVYDAVLTDWLAGPESENPAPSDEYVAFTCLGMALDSAQSRQKMTIEEAEQIMDVNLPLAPQPHTKSPQ